MMGGCSGEPNSYSPLAEGWQAKPDGVVHYIAYNAGIENYFRSVAHP